MYTFTEHGTKMKINQLPFLALLLFYMAACANNIDNETAGDATVMDSSIASVTAAADTFETGKIISKVVCRADASQSYALYLPENENMEELPAVYFFDPHGDGTYPLSKYKSLPYKTATAPEKAIDLFSF